MNALCLECVALFAKWSTKEGVEVGDLATCSSCGGRHEVTQVHPIVNVRTVKTEADVAQR